MNFFTPGHMAIIAVVVILLFGFKRLPDAARSLGKSMRIFKSEIKELNNDGKTEDPPKPTVVESERIDTPAPEKDHTDARPA